MELRIGESKGSELTVNFEEDCLDFCCLNSGKGQQYNFIISKSEWQTLKIFVDAQIREWEPSVKDKDYDVTSKPQEA